MKRKMTLISFAWVLLASMSFGVYAATEETVGTVEETQTPPSQPAKKRQYTIIVGDTDKETTYSHRERRLVMGKDITGRRDMYRGHSKTAHFSGFGIGFISMSPMDDSGKDMARNVDMSSSLKYDLSFFDVKYSLGANNLSFVSGLGIEFNSIHFTKNHFLNFARNQAFITDDIPAGKNMSNARFHTTYLKIPALIEVNSGKRHGTSSPMFFNFGVLFKVKTASSSKVWWAASEENHSASKQIIDKGLGLRPVHLDFIVQAGIGNFGLFATYSPISPFQKDFGPNVSTFSTGLKLYFSQW